MLLVVSYRNSTSNHNQNTRSIGRSIVVSYRNSTSNHNPVSPAGFAPALYLIEILHQTTTQQTPRPAYVCCILSKFYIKPQLRRFNERLRHSCILSKFYIKPQPAGWLPSRTTCCILSKFYIKPQLARSTYKMSPRCILSKFYIKPQLYPVDECPAIRCILSKFYIKPQQLGITKSDTSVVSYRNSTSNHNSVEVYSLPLRLYLIEILHQTTTMFAVTRLLFRCILSKFYIKPQLRRFAGFPGWRCILSKFYIKPQLVASARSACVVVSYRNSTSNHNSGRAF